MSVFMVTWNLNKERSNYNKAREAFIRHLERYPNVADPGLETVRWIVSSDTAGDVSSDLESRLDSNDRLFVTRLAAGTYQGWLSQATWKWIEANM